MNEENEEGYAVQTCNMFLEDNNSFAWTVSTGIKRLDDFLK